ncbi:MAG: hypothetical protein ACTS2F_22580 [Thainema sp.]
MSELTEALDKILVWLKQYKPDYADTFLPGLSREEIEAKVSGLPGNLPEEMYELYQWRNGASEEDIQVVVYPALGFDPLDEAVKVCKGILKGFGEEHPFLFEGKMLFPFLRNNCSFCAVLLDQEQQTHSPVIDIAAEGDLELMYTSLTNMMLTLAEYCESGAYYIGKVDEEEGGRPEEAEGFLCADETKMLPIFEKYNSGLRLIR